MKGTVGAIAVGVLGAVVVGLVFFWAYDQPLPRHTEVPDGAVTIAEIAVDRRAGAEEDLPLMVQGLVSVCLLEVRGGLADEGIRGAADERFVVRIEPGLDDADRRQLHGCLEDWRVDHLLAQVVRLETVSGPVS